jgi:CRISPR/Cas system CMR subunit Cmr6 (Cas7 group RAMP superfamily)
MAVMKVKLTSLQPLLMHSAAGINPMNPLTKEMKSLTSKRKKTDEDHQRILEISYEMALYYDDEMQCPYIPSTCLEGTLRNAAKKIRRGTDVISSITVTPNNIPLEYDGVKKKKDLMEAFKVGKFCDIRNGRNPSTGSGITLCRPRFDKWAITCEIDYDEGVFNEDEIKALLIVGGTKIGLCDYRPKYGTFAAKIVN